MIYIWNQQIDRISIIFGEDIVQGPRVRILLTSVEGVPLVEWNGDTTATPEYSREFIACLEHANAILEGLQEGKSIDSLIPESAFVLTPGGWKEGRDPLLPCSIKKRSMKSSELALEDLGENLCR